MFSYHKCQEWSGVWLYICAVDNDVTGHTRRASPSEYWHLWCIRTLLRWVWWTWFLISWGTARMQQTNHSTPVQFNPFNICFRYLKHVCYGWSGIQSLDTRPRVKFSPSSDLHCLISTTWKTLYCRLHLLGEKLCGAKTREVILDVGWIKHTLSINPGIWSCVKVNSGRRPAWDRRI